MSSSALHLLCLTIQCRFRELCEDSTPIKALSYLQTEVSAVVDHSDAEETRIFRSLLSHLFSPVATETPPSKKRTRDEYASEDTSKPSDEDDLMQEDGSADSQDTATPTTSTPGVRIHENLPEKTSEGSGLPTPNRYKQRTDVFEKLMAFVNADAKQPEKDLIRLINVDSDDVY